MEHKLFIIWGLLPVLLIFFVTADEKLLTLFLKNTKCVTKSVLEHKCPQILKSHFDFSIVHNSSAAILWNRYTVTDFIVI